MTWPGSASRWVLALSALVSSAAAQAQEQPASTAVQTAIAVGASAKLLCSAVFVSGREQKDVIADDLGSFLPDVQAMAFDVDRTLGVVTTTLGPIRRVATFRSGRGCTLDLAPDVAGASATEASPVTPAASLPSLAPPAAPAMAKRLKLALDTAMADVQGPLRTRAIVVMHKGRVVAERYAPGFSATMPLLGWSMSKSITAAVAGLAVGDGRLRLDDPMAAPEWFNGDPRATITLRQGLQMTSGLSFVEDYSLGNDSSRMLFTNPDMAGYAALQPLAALPGTRWSYSSGSTNIVARALAKALGGGDAMRTFMHERLFRPAGMTDVTVEEDAAGTLVGSSFVYATARDWGRFGQLFLGRGQIDGRQILDPAWVDFVRTPVGLESNGNYGGSFWLNGKAAKGEGLTFPNLPADAYFLLGFNGQVVGIFPEQDAVIVRLGWTTGATEYDTDGNFQRILAALPTSR